MQDPFLDKAGCHVLSSWLVPMPDKTYPNPKIVMCILNCINRLPITSGYLSECRLEDSLELYKDGDPGSGYNECQMLAKNILNNWYRATRDLNNI